MEARLTCEAQRVLFRQVFNGSLTDLLESRLASDQVRAVLGMVALNANLALPSSPGTAVGLMLRPISLASAPAVSDDDARRMPLRGSTGLPVGGMGAVIDALASSCRQFGGVLQTGSKVAKLLHRNGRVTGVVTAAGDEFRAPAVISTIDPRRLFADLLDDVAVSSLTRQEVTKLPINGSTFKIVLALDGLPEYRGLGDVPTTQVIGAQFRIGPSLDYIEQAVQDALEGRCSDGMLMWGLFTSVTSPHLAPTGKHICSVSMSGMPHTAFAKASGRRRPTCLGSGV